METSLRKAPCKATHINGLWRSNPNSSCTIHSFKGATSLMSLTSSPARVTLRCVVVCRICVMGSKGSSASPKEIFSPVPATLVVMTADEQGRRVEIPRSRTSGYDYNPQRNAIAFFGAYSPRSSSGHTCGLGDTPVCPPGDRCISNRCVRD